MLLPETEVVPVTANVGVVEPEITTELTEVGVMAPRARVKFGVAPPEEEPEIPLAVVTPIPVTVPFPVAAIFPFSLCNFYSAARGKQMAMSSTFGWMRAVKGIDAESYNVIN